jgi:transcriptional regulator with XRE-family HTH domain
VTEAAADRVRLLREWRGFSIAELARHAGLARGTVSRIEHGRQQPHWMTLLVIANALDVDVDDLAR